MQPVPETELVPPAIPNVPTIGAGFGIRFLARFIDLLFSYLLGLGGGILIGIVFGLLEHFGRISPEWQTSLTQSSPLGIGILAALCYHVVADAVSGASLGKLICGLRTVHTDGTPCSLAGALKRDLAFHVDGLFLGIIGYTAMKESAKQQRYGDRWAKTMVVKAREFTSTPPRSWIALTLGVIAAAFAWLGVVWLDLVLMAFVL